ncbi:MAG: PqqD family peptide modification chaperone [Nitrosopumilaceae archaeon]|nr:PqqD family peptide modification chaperone [Nitrosopumilaceae archaeon]
MKINFDCKITVPEEIIIQQTIDGESIILNTKEENYYVLNEVGTDFYNNLVNSKNIYDALIKLHDSYEVDRNTLEKDLQGFINDLKNNSLIDLEMI